VLQAREPREPGTARDGRDAAVRALYAAHGDELFRFAVRSLDDRGAAEEAVQETFVRAWRAWDRFDAAIAGVRAWLFAILRNVVIDIARAQSVRPRVVDITTPVERAERVAPDELDRIVVAWQVEEALRRLSADHRYAVVEVHCRGRAYDDVARELGVPVGTVKSRVYYALKLLRLAFDEMGIDRDD
jgi:RNA polymerase sigma-70 factor (ECF subfamily)